MDVHIRGADIMPKGDQHERKLVNWFFDRGWYAQRAGSSGAATDVERADIIALKYNEYGLSTSVAIEMKAYSDGYGAIDNDEYQQLVDVHERSGAIPLLVIWPDLRSHPHRYAFGLDELNNNEKSYSVRKSDLESASSLSEKLDFIESEKAE